jgi:hypothetical protein
MSNQPRLDAGGLLVFECPFLARNTRSGLHKNSVPEIISRQFFIILKV